MKALVYHGAKDIRFEYAPDPCLETPRDALVRVTRAAICGSDLHLYRGLPLPDTGFAVGHEAVGVVEDAGAAVDTLRRGDRVLISCTLGCGTCASCRAGLFSGCAVTTAGGTHSNVLGFSAAHPGGQAELVRVPFADVNAFRIPEALSDEQALFLTDILPTAAFGAELAGIGPGDRVVVLGCGPVGLLAQACSRVRGAAQVIAVDPEAGRRDRAAADGAVGVDPNAVDPAARVWELTGGRGADAVIEAVGRPELVDQAARMLRPGGRLAVIGVITAPVELAWPLFFMRNLSLHTGLVNPQRHMGALLPLLESGRLDPTALVTHRFPLAEGARAYGLFDARAEGALKVVLAP